MGIFDRLFGKKEQKETLDNGLQKTREGFFGKLAKAVVGKSVVDEEVLDEIENALVSADVGIATTVKIIERLENRIKSGKYLNISELNTILKKEIQEILITSTVDNSYINY